MAENNTGLSSTLAQSILCFGYAECDNSTNTGSFRKRNRRTYSESSIDNPILENQIDLSPNPANTVIQIEFEEKSQEQVRIEIYDLLGKSVMNRVLIDYNNVLNINHLKNGVYLYKVIVGNKVVKQDKLVIQH